ncbi:MAG: deoxyribodipyrimidine photo-lyase [Gemmatimonadaceae bacterium]|nr:deoxyribodipyrimidine photo-lyase [Gemmatimonadaceae bacterium]MCW5826582.1 deoxyribodipyrimidine photo-lyase [Gemmatimonadaceae bacterium]
MTAPHRLESEYVRGQLALRRRDANAVPARPDGEYVLYWMQSTHRFEDNWALRYAVLQADALGRPLLVHQGLDPTYEHANDRIHTVILENAKALHRRAAALGLRYQFVLRRRRDDDRRSVDHLAARAALVVTDLFPTAGVAERTQRFAARCPVRVVEVESHCIVPFGAFVKEEYAARTIRPKIAKVLDHALERVEDRGPRACFPDALWTSLDVDRLALDTLDLPATVASCEIDHDVPPVPFASGLDGARARLAAFCGDALADYAERRNEPSDTNGSSRLSPYLHFGQISAAEVLRTVRAAGHKASAEKFADELVTWRELAFNFCVRNPEYGKLKGLPDWVHRSMAKHKDDPREAIYTLAQLERAESHDELWNAAQRELVRTGFMHNVTRMLWGKSVLLWTARYKHALEHLILLNNKYGLDGRDPSSYGGIQWCFGKFDRPWFDKPVFGVIRPMSLERARKKFDAEAYIRMFPA